jgi:hypothetical protein
LLNESLLRLLRGEAVRRAPNHPGLASGLFALKVSKRTFGQIPLSDRKIFIVADIPSRAALIECEKFQKILKGSLPIYRSVKWEWLGLTIRAKPPRTRGWTSIST